MAHVAARNMLCFSSRGSGNFSDFYCGPQPLYRILVTVHAKAYHKALVQQAVPFKTLVHPSI
jgi:hypothetical protein